MSRPLAEPKAIGSPPGAFRVALDLLKNVGARGVLDCPAGEGAFSRILLENGFDVTSSDICPEQFKVEGIECDFADLNEKLPYSSSRFDAVVCLNGLQRVWARGRAVKELARVVKPGGRVVISFPNNGDIRRRLLFMLTGSVTWNVIGPPHVCLPEAANPAAWFRYPMTLANVLTATKSVGLELESVCSTHYSKGALFLAPLMIGPKLFCWVVPKRYKEFYLVRQTATLDALLGAWLVVISKKSD